jgi:hypothetical protein
MMMKQALYFGESSRMFLRPEYTKDKIMQLGFTYLCVFTAWLVPEDIIRHASSSLVKHERVVLRLPVEVYFGEILEDFGVNLITSKLRADT